MLVHRGRRETRKKGQKGKMRGRDKAREKEEGLKRKREGNNKKKSFPGRILLEAENMIEKRRLLGRTCQPCGELREASKQRL